MIARVAVNLPILMDDLDYNIPASLDVSLTSGMLVTVPVQSQIVQGIVTDIVSESDFADLKNILSVVDSQPVLTPQQLKLAGWIAKNTLSPLSSCLAAMVPSGLLKYGDKEYRLATAEAPSREPKPGLEKRLLKLVQNREPIRGRQISRALPRMDWRNAALGLVQAGWLVSTPVLAPPSIQPRIVKTAALAKTPAAIDQLTQPLSKKPEVHARRLRVLNFLRGEPLPVALGWITAQTSANRGDITALAEDDWLTLGENEVFRDPLEDYEVTPDTPPQLYPQQQAVWEQIQTRLSQYSGHTAAAKPSTPMLIHGVTGSGKTELYLQAAAQTLAQGKQVLILVPEISLTPQTAYRFLARFPGQVGLIHSRLSEGELYDTWRRSRSGDLNVIIGPRSALFSCLPNLGLIVIDEFHEEHYFQQDPAPRYHAVESAIAYAQMIPCPILLGSATPDIALYARAKKEDWTILNLPDRVKPDSSAGKSTAKTFLPLPKVEIIDMRSELKQGNTSVISRQLQTALTEVLKKNQQAILYLNRRGSSTYVFCRDCGTPLSCPRCTSLLTAHANDSILRCHTCAYQKQMPKTCPVCKSKHIRALGSGTEKLEKTVQNLLPGARILRWDADTTRDQKSHHILLNYFRNHQADILLGTQMLAKGLDLPLVTLVGVVLAEVGLNFPDYRAAERGFQLLTQVAGRAGRSSLGGKVIFQTYQPDHVSIQMAASHDFESFAQYELEQRRRLNYPPYSTLIRLEIRDMHEAKAEQQAVKLAQELRARLYQQKRKTIEVLGPMPCYFPKENAFFRWQVLLRGLEPLKLLEGVNLASWRVEVNPPSVL